MTRKPRSSTVRGAPRPTVEDAYAHALAMFGHRPDVTGVDVGPKYTDGKKRRIRAVRIHVREKHRGTKVTESERVPKQLLGVPTDVIVGRYRRHGDVAPGAVARCNPIQPGISIGNAKAEAGTLGLIVYDSDTGACCLLGSFHVLAGPQAAEGDPISQPARLDGGIDPGDTVANLFRFFLPGPWGDAALARITNDRKFLKQTLGSGVVIDRVALPAADLKVEKSGRTTGVTRGHVEAIGTYYYPEVPSGVSGFMVVPDVDNPGRSDLSAPGDSGAVYYIQGTTTGIGMHCAGGTDPKLGEVGIACSLARVMATLRVSLTPLRV